MELHEIQKKQENLRNKVDSVNASEIMVKLLKEKENLLEELAKKRALMTKEDILKYANQMHCVMRGDFKGVSITTPEKYHRPLFFIDATGVATQSCTFSSKPIAEAKKLKKLGTITTYHSYGGHYVFLRPSADEAIWQCPKEWLDKATAFEFSFIKSDQLSEVYDCLLDCHVLETTYYQVELPDVVKEKKMTW
ncbi:MAG: hypothetical protein IKW39_04055 [Alphaproteobacteria bacterium]|nr:hypothetical protein [Alphaproteobacteria bacterium]